MRNEILMMTDYGERSLTQAQVCKIFINTPRIIQSAVNKRRKFPRFWSRKG